MDITKGAPPHPVDIQVGSRIRSARVARGLSQGALAEKIGVTFQQVQKYENGSNRVSASMLVEIADTLSVTPAGFLEGLGALAHGDSAPLPPDAHDLTALYAALPPVMRKAVLDLARTLAEAKPPPQTR